MQILNTSHQFICIVVTLLYVGSINDFHDIDFTNYVTNWPFPFQTQRKAVQMLNHRIVIFSLQLVY